MRRLLIEQGIGMTLPMGRNFSSVNEAKVAGKIEPCTIDIENGKYFVNALLQRADVENKNGRIYPKHILDRECQRYMEQIRLGAAVGENDHPEDSVVSLQRNPHRVVDLWWDGNDLHGRLELLVSKPFKESGYICCEGDRIAMYIGEYGMYVGVSSRGVGSLESRDGKNVVQDDYELICWDTVQGPSTHNSYMYSESPVTHETNESKNSASPNIFEGRSPILSKYDAFIIG